MNLNEIKTTRLNGLEGEIIANMNYDADVSYYLLSGKNNPLHLYFFDNIKITPIILTTFDFIRFKLYIDINDKLLDNFIYKHYGEYIKSVSTDINSLILVMDILDMQKQFKSSINDFIYNRDGLINNKT